MSQVTVIRPPFSIDPLPERPSPRIEPPVVAQPGQGAERFDTLGLPDNLLKAVSRQGFSRPTPIQVQAIPLLLAGRDLLASAATGSGKTAAFLLPILKKLQERPRGGTRALVLTPTRELAAQILDHCQTLSAGSGVRAAAIFGGVAVGPQEKAFREGVDVIIATPGRLLDHLNYPYARLDKIECLVLDEADRMLDMGFLPDVRRIMKRCPAQRQTMLFSATLPQPIVDLARDYQHEPVAVHIEAKPRPPVSITHRAFAVPAELKSRMLVEILRREQPGSVLVFTRTRHRANRLADFLIAQQVPCDRIHGSRTQAQRTSALAAFRERRCQVLVATDLAARGLDVPALDLVVNFDVPLAMEDYIHRVGRTGRAQMTGNAYTLISPEEEGEVVQIERGIGKRIPREKLNGFDCSQPVQGRFEIPLAERIAAIRARKAEERQRSKAKAEAKQSRQAGSPSPRPSGPNPAKASSGSASRPGQDRFAGRPGRPAKPGRTVPVGHPSFRRDPSSSDRPRSNQDGPPPRRRF